MKKPTKKQAEEHRINKEKSERRMAFIRELASFLVDAEIEMSIKLQMKDPSALRWQRLRITSPLFGYYPDKEKAVRELDEFLR